MTGTASYAAGVESNDVVLSYGLEAAWATPPATTFQALRITAEGLSGKKTRTRPNEITTTGEVSQAVTTQESAGGTVSCALSFGTTDDLLASCFNADWQGAQTIAGVAGDIVLTETSGLQGTISSATSNKFTAISVGQYIRTLGFTNAANNNYFYVSAKADAETLTVIGLVGAGPLVTETPSGTTAQIRANTLINGVTFKSIYLQKKLSSSLWLQYPGSFITQATISGGLGKFLDVQFTVVAQEENSATVDASTGGVTAALTGSVNNPVGNFKGVTINEAATSGAVDQFSIQIQRSGAVAEYALGSPAAQGMIKGQMMVSGSLRMFFKTFTEYANFKSETMKRIAFVTEDGAGNGYVVSLPSGALMDPQIVAGGVNQPVYCSFTLEGNPQSAGGTVRIDALPAT